MSIDYDRLRELSEYASPGPWRTDEHPYMDGQSVYNADGTRIAQHLSGNNAELVALAPDMARELLRLRDGLDDLLSVMAHEGECLHKDYYPLTRKYLATYADKLALLLEGDTE